MGQLREGRCQERGGKGRGSQGKRREEKWRLEILFDVSSLHVDVCMCERFDLMQVTEPLGLVALVVVHGIRA
jgi:hypothetical protein